MGYTTFGGVRYWEPTEAASVHGASNAQALSLEPKVIGQFATTVARNAAAAALIAAGKKGFHAWVDGVGECVYDGSDWRVMPLRGLNYNIGVGEGVTDTNGLLSVDHGLNTAAINIELSQMHAGNDLVTYVTKIHLQEIQQTFFVVRAMDLRENPPIPMNVNNIKIHWRAEKL